MAEPHKARHLDQDWEETFAESVPADIIYQIERGVPFQVIREEWSEDYAKRTIIEVELIDSAFPPLAI